MKSKESSQGVREKLGRSGAKEKGLALVMAAIGVITAGVSTGCQPIVVAHGRSTTFEKYNNARRSCNHLPTDTGDHDDCMRQEIDSSRK